MVQERCTTMWTFDFMQMRKPACVKVYELPIQTEAFIAEEQPRCQELRQLSILRLNSAKLKEWEKSVGGTLLKIAEYWQQWRRCWGKTTNFILLYIKNFCPQEQGKMLPVQT